MTVVAVVVLMGLLGLVLLRGRIFRVGCFSYAGVWGLLLGSTKVGPAVHSLLNTVGAAVWAAVRDL